MFVVFLPTILGPEMADLRFFGVLAGGKPYMPIEFPRFRGGVPILFLWARGFSDFR